jgi:hypothetical protein
LFVNDSQIFSDSPSFDLSLPFVTAPSAVTVGGVAIGVIVSIVSSVVILIGLIVVFLIVKKRIRKTEESSDVIFQEFCLEAGDESSVATTIDELFGDTIPDGLLTVTHTVEDGD